MIEVNLVFWLFGQTKSSFRTKRKNLHCTSDGLLSIFLMKKREKPHLLHPLIKQAFVHTRLKNFKSKGFRVKNACFKCEPQPRTYQYDLRSIVLNITSDCGALNALCPMILVEFPRHAALSRRHGSDVSGGTGDRPPPLPPGQHRRRGVCGYEAPADRSGLLAVPVPRTMLEGASKPYIFDFPPLFFNTNTATPQFSRPYAVRLQHISDQSNATEMLEMCSDVGSRFFPIIFFATFSSTKNDFPHCKN